MCFKKLNYIFLKNLKLSKYNDLKKMVTVNFKTNFSVFNFLKVNNN